MPNILANTFWCACITVAYKFFQTRISSMRH